jgi:hypothetical protein
MNLASYNFEAKRRKRSGDRFEFRGAGYLGIVVLALFVLSCGGFKPVIVWDVWGPIPKSSYEEAVQTLKAYKGSGTAYLVHGRAKNESHVELWIDEGSGPNPVGFSALMLGGRITRMEPAIEKESYATEESSAAFSFALKTYHTTAALFNKGWNYSKKAILRSYSVLIDFARQVTGR